MRGGKEVLSLSRTASTDPLNESFRMAGTSGPGAPEVDAPPTPNNNWLTDADSFDILMHRSHRDKKAVFRKISILRCLRLVNR
ncbi:hypothetical protein CEXT_35141 [Caerostris extrusa]|uniref:Uncharacterized protein n=1 Tax=Caerostris extrusa TaxID=172846 RepID=A0AAV4VRI2_CAEEX|nr:hypothetical protein CEXT_35141 [Caerostris extrusa]